MASRSIGAGWRKPDTGTPALDGLFGRHEGVFKIIAEPLDADAPPAAAIVVAKDPDEALILLRKDVNFSGYVLPPAEMIPMNVDADEVRRVLGEDAAHEKGVYGFRLIGAETPTLPSD